MGGNDASCTGVFDWSVGERLKQLQDRLGAPRGPPTADALQELVVSYVLVFHHVSTQCPARDGNPHKPARLKCGK